MNMPWYRFPQSTFLTQWSDVRLLGLILMGALVVRVAIVLYLDIVPVSDYAGYHSMAINLLSGRGLTDGESFAMLSAGYPLFVLVPIFAVFGDNLLAAQLGNALLGVLTTWLIYLIAREVGAGRIGRLVAPLIFAFYLPSWIYAEYLAKENLMTPLMLGIVLLSVRCLRDASVWVSLLLGVLIGLLAITGNAGLAILPVAFLALAMMPISLRGRGLRMGLVGLVAMLVIAPWLMRNDAVIGEPILNSNGGFNLYLGNNPAANGFFVSIADTPRGATWPQLREEGEVIASNTLKIEAIDWIKRNPYDFLALAVTKGRLFWMPPVHEGKGVQSRVEVMTRVAWLGQYLFICTLAIGSAAFVQLRNRKTGLLWLAIVGYTAVHMIFYVIFRYREPVMPLMILLSALAIEHLWKLQKTFPKVAPRRQIDV
jgi:4-amino-4-deoxy-L-arabinose transferase-like glycosyltransferase